MNSLEVLSPIYYNLPTELRSRINKADVFCILNLEKAYYRKVASKMNTPKNLIAYIMQEAKSIGENYSEQTVENVIATKKKLFTD
jgi:hypothetical protein